MSRIQEALCLAIVLLALALLAVVGAFPAPIAQYAPLAAAVWIIRRDPACLGARG